MISTDLRDASPELAGVYRMADSCINTRCELRVAASQAKFSDILTDTPGGVPGMNIDIGEP